MSNDAPQIRFKGFTDAWEQRKLGEVCIVTMGQSPDGKNYTDNPNDHILVQGNADMKDGKVHPRVWTTQVTKIARAGDIILSVRAPVGDVGKTDYDIVLGRGVAGINGNEFVYQILLAMKENAFWVKLSTGSTFESINSSHVKDSLINIPASEEQINIGNFFHTLDNLITLHKRKLDGLKELKRGYLNQMFPRSEESTPRVRFKGFMELWEKQKFGDVAKIRRGLTYSPANIRNDGVRVLRSSNIDGDTFVLKNDDVFVEPQAINIDFIKENDILITSANGSSRLVGKHALINKNCKNTVHGGFMLLATADEPEFVNALMSSPWYDKFINVYVSGGNGAIGNLSKTDLEEQCVFVPEAAEQIIVGNLFHMLDEQISAQKKKLSQLKQLKSAYLQKMFI